MERTITPPIDPRNALIILILSNIIAFTQEHIYIEVGYFIVLCIFLIIFNCKKQVVKWGIIFILILIIQYIIFPIINKGIVTAFIILTIYMRKMLPCLMVGTIIVNKIPMEYIILAMKKFHLPQKAIIPLSITIRYIPSIYMEYRCIRDAMKLRDIKRLKKIEYIIVPIMINATKTADELSAAAVTRGIENPKIKTSLIDTSFCLIDFIFLILAICFVILSILSKGAVL